MSLTYGFFNSVNHDRQYDARDFSRMLDGLINDGVYSNIGQKFSVTPTGSGMSVNIGSGRAWFDGTWTYNDATFPLVIPQSDLVYPRIDIVVIEVNTGSSVRANTIKVVSGTPAASPIAPTLTHTDEINQYPLAEVRVPAGATTIVSGNITIKVGTTACPFVTAIVQQTDISTLWANWNAQYAEWFAEATTEFSGWEDISKAEFNTWFANLQYVLDGDVAGHLQNEIDSKQNNELIENKVLSASGWTEVDGRTVYDLTTWYPNDEYDIIDVLCNRLTTTNARKAWQRADCIGYEDTNILVVNGIETPAIDINVTIISRPKTAGQYTPQPSLSE